MLILPMLFGAFRPPKPENRILLRYPLDGHEVHLFKPCNHLPSPGLCKVFELRMIVPEVEHFASPGPQGKIVAGPPGTGFGGRKGPSGMGKISTLGVLRLRAIKRCVTR